MISIGNHMKMDAPAALRQRLRVFYRDLLECRALDSPRPDLDLYEFAGGFVVGIFFVGWLSALSDDTYLQATWLEIKTDAPEELKRKLLAFNVRVLDYEDTSRFYFQAPGGQVFRIAPLEGGI